MELQTISQVSKSYGISLRMLRYYEKEGLLESTRKEDYAYRAYDDAAIHRLRQIIILRKLRIPVKQIKTIFDNQDAVAAIDIFQKSISEVDEEITALSTIKTILKQFVDELQAKASVSIHPDMLTDPSMLPLIDSLSISKHQIKENISMEALSKATDVLNKLDDVRIVYLPPMTVAAAFFTEENAQDKAWQTILDFIKGSALLEAKPDLRVFRISHDNATGQHFGNEVWVSIPDDFAVPAHLIKKQFLGGQYAAHVLGEDGFLTYLGMQDWINENDRYQYDFDGNLTRTEPPLAEIDSFGGINLDPEEILNIQEVLQGTDTPIQYDVLFPVKKYIETDDVPVYIPGSEEKCGYKTSIVQKNKFRIIGFTEIMIADAPGKNPADFEKALLNDGRMDILNRYRKAGAPVLGFGSIDMDSQMRGGWRWTICLAESDITDVDALLKHDPYVRTIDAAKWLVFEYEKGEAFDDHQTCMKLGYTWNGIISGSFNVWPDGKIGKPDPDNEADMKSTVYCWYPVK